MTPNGFQIEPELDVVTGDVPARQVAPIEWRIVGLSSLYLILDYIIRGIPHAFRIGGEKPGLLSEFLAVSLAVGVLMTSRRLRGIAGLTWKLKRGSWPLSLCCVFASGIVAGALAFIWPKAPKDVFNILLLIVAVPIIEELTYRGIALGALCRAFGSRGEFWPVVISSTFFALAHVVSIRHGEVAVSPVRFLITIVLGLLCGVARTYSGGLIAAVLCHMAWNASVDLLPFIR